MKGNCRLCTKEKTLKNSHIIPEFMYDGIYDYSPKRFYKILLDIEDYSNSKTKYEQKGIREYLLCGTCEGLIAKYERYGAETIYAKNKHSTANLVNKGASEDGKYVFYDYKGFSYKDFKLFLMSIFWRLLISEKFTEINGDETLRESLRLAILNENPLNYNTHGCLVQAICYEPGRLARGFILNPYLTKSKDVSMLNQLIDGFIYSFPMNSLNLTEDFENYFLKPDGSLRILGRLLRNDKPLFEKILRGYEFHPKL